MTSKNSYIKADDSTLINETSIQWVKKIEECLYVCVKKNGCDLKNTRQICKSNNPDSYSKFNQHFQK